MKKRVLAIVLILVMMAPLCVAVNAKAAGPFGHGGNWDSDKIENADYDDFYASGAKTARDALNDALEGRTLAADPTFIDGAEGFGDEVYGEWPYNLFDLSWHKLDEDGETRSSKYCGNDGFFPFWVEWKYDQAFIADSFLIATANDCEAWPRRMNDGWTLSGSNDGAAWTVIYTGQGDDYEPVNFAWWRIDLPDNAAEYQYYKLYAEDRYEDQDQNIIQMSNLALSKKVIVEAAPADEAPAAAPEAAPEAPAPAPTRPPSANTGDAGIAALILAMMISAAGFVTIKKRVSIK